MDPYLEPHWLDVHSALVIGARDALNELLPEDLVASVEERIAIEAPGEEEHAYAPDVRVLEPRAASPAVEGEAPRAVDAPFRLTVLIEGIPVEGITERFLNVIVAGSGRLITVIEVVSPTKVGEGLRTFRKKRDELLASGVNFVEIDLHRSGPWRALLRPHVCPPTAVTPYRVTLRVPVDSAAVYLHPIRLAEPLPTITIPLRPSDPSVRLDLQALITRVYQTGRYARRIDYTQPCQPPLEGEDAAWAQRLLRGP